MSLPAKKALLGAVFLAALLLASRQASACETDADCKSGRVCRNTVCTTPELIEPKPQACVREKDCPGDQACTAGFCSPSATPPGAASAPTPAPGPGPGWNGGVWVPLIDCRASFAIPQERVA